MGVEGSAAEGEVLEVERSGHSTEGVRDPLGETQKGLVQEDCVS